MDNSFEKRIQNQFGAFCVKVLKNEANRILNEYTKHHSNETSLDSPEATYLSQPIVDLYFFDEHLFEVKGLEIVVLGDLLADALSKLPERKRAILLLHYFVGMSDRKICNLFGISHQAISKCRAAALKELKILLEKEGFE